MSDRLSTVGRLAVTALGLGRLRPAPGTWGSLPPVAVAIALLASGAPDWSVSLLMSAGAVAASVACLRFGDRAEAEFSGKDPSSVVIDEVAGQCVALLWLPWSRLAGDPVLGAMSQRQFLLAIAAFLLFRAFDIVKPPPARGLQRLRGGTGILVDDLIAGAYALGASWLVAWWLLSAL